MSKVPFRVGVTSGFESNARGLLEPARAAVIDLEGRTLGSIGLGSIGGEMFRLARAIGFGRLLAYSVRTPPTLEAPEVELTDLDTVMRESDFVAINCPLTVESRGMIGARE